VRDTFTQESGRFKGHLIALGQRLPQKHRTHIMFGHFMHGLGPLGPAANFEASYIAYPVSFIDKLDAENGDKVFLPPSALDRLCKPLSTT